MGLERLAMFLQGKRTAFDLEWAPGLTWGDVYRENERQWSIYNFEEAPVDVLDAALRRARGGVRAPRRARPAAARLRPGAEVLAHPSTCSTRAARSPPPSGPPTSAACANLARKVAQPLRRRCSMPTLLLEIGCEELPASACSEAEAQLPELVRSPLGADADARLRGAAAARVRRRRAAGARPPTRVKGPPAERREQAAAGFAKRYGIDRSTTSRSATAPLGARARGAAARRRCPSGCARSSAGSSSASRCAGTRAAIASRGRCGGCSRSSTARRWPGSPARPSATASRTASSRSRPRRSTPRRCGRRRRARRRPSVAAASSTRSTRSATGRTRSGSSRRSCTWSSGRSSSSRSSTSGSCACPSA